MKTNLGLSKRVTTSSEGKQAIDGFDLKSSVMKCMPSIARDIKENGLQYLKNEFYDAEKLPEFVIRVKEEAKTWEAVVWATVWTGEYDEVEVIGIDCHLDVCLVGLYNMNTGVVYLKEVHVTLEDQDNWEPLQGMPKIVFKEEDGEISSDVYDAASRTLNMFDYSSLKEQMLEESKIINESDLGLSKRVSKKYEGPDLDKRLDDTVESFGIFSSVDDALVKIREYLTKRGYNVVEWWNYKGGGRPSYSKDRKCATICKNSKTREKNDERLKNFILSIYSVPNLGKYASYMNHVTIGIGTSATMPSPDEPVPPFFWSGAGLERDIEGFSNFFEHEGEVPLSPYIVRKLVDFVEERYNNGNKPIVANESSLGLAKITGKRFAVRDSIDETSEDTMKQVMCDNILEIFGLDDQDDLEQNLNNYWGYHCEYNEGEKIIGDSSERVWPGIKLDKKILKKPLMQVESTLLGDPSTGCMIGANIRWHMLDSRDHGELFLTCDDIPEEIYKEINDNMEVEDDNGMLSEKFEHEDDIPEELQEHVSLALENLNN